MTYQVPYDLFSWTCLLGFNHPALLLNPSSLPDFFSTQGIYTGHFFFWNVLLFLCLPLVIIFSVFFFFCHTTWHVGSEFPDQGPNLLPQWRKHGFLTTGASEKSPSCRHLNLNSRATFSERPCLIIIDKAFLFFPLIHPNASFDPYHSTDQYLKLHEVTFMCSFPCLLFSVP